MDVLFYSSAEQRFFTSRSVSREHSTDDGNVAPDITDKDVMVFEYLKSSHLSQIAMQVSD